jgi:hypothetical protein
MPASTSPSAGNGFSGTDQRPGRTVLSVGPPRRRDAQPSSGDVFAELVRPPMLWWSILAVAVTVGGVIVLPTLFAVVPGILVSAVVSTTAVNRIRERREAGPPH